MSTRNSPVEDQTDEETWLWVQGKLGQLEKRRPETPTLDQILSHDRRVRGKDRHFHSALSPLIPLVAIVAILGVALTTVWRFPAGIAGGTQAAESTGATSTPSPIATPVVPGTLARCDSPAPSAPAFLPSEDEPVPFVGRHGVAGEPILLAGLTIDPGQAEANGIHLLWPSSSPSGLPLLHALLSPAGAATPPQDRQLFVIFSSVPRSQFTISEILLDGGLVLTEGLPEGRDADTVLARLANVGSTGHVKIVVVAGMPTAIVHGDPINAAGDRPWGLYWSDGIRGMSISSLGDPNQLIKYAHSLYCGA